MGDRKKLQAPGRRALTAASVLFIVYGCLALFVLSISILLTGTTLDFAFVVTFFYLFVLPLATQIFAGIIGIIYCNNLEKAGLLLFMGIIALFIALYHILGGTFLLFTGIPNLIFSIVYIYGAQKNLGALK